jgi:hypothetical protein
MSTNTTISQLPAVVTPELNAVVAVDNAASTQTEKMTISQIRSLGPAAHAASHASAGADPITASSIGAADLAHAFQHGTGGVDPITPAAIGAATSSHSHTNATTSVAGFLSAADKTMLGDTAAAIYAVGTSELSANADNLSPGSGPVTRLTSTLAVNITGVVAGVSGQFRYLYNAGNFNITLSHNSSSSTAGNRFLVYNGVSLPLTPGSSATLLYDATSQAWRVF